MPGSMPPDDDRPPVDPMSSVHWWSGEGDEPDPRWSLANERTFLAYNRTALALVVAGLAAIGSHVAADAPLWIAAFGLPLLCLGAYVAVMGRHRLLEAQRAMRLGEPLPPPPLGTVLTVGIVGIALAAVVVGIVTLLS